MAEIHRDKNGNPMKGAALVSHIIHTHDGGLEEHDSKIVRETEQRLRRSQIGTRHVVRQKRQNRSLLDRLLKR